MRRACAAVVIALAALASTTCDRRPTYRDPSAAPSRRVADLLSRMTLEEKVAQMLTIWRGKRDLVDDEGRFDPARAASALKNGIGQVARPHDGLERKGRKRSARETVGFVNAIQRWVIEHTRLGVPVLFHEEALHGLMAPGGTQFPVPIGLASTWDPPLVERAFAVVAREARSRGVHLVLSPVLDLARDPRWGRAEETYGEDPFLVSEMGLAAIRGYQGSAPRLGPGRVFATAKHFAAHGPHEGGVNTAPTPVGPRELREVLLRPFERAVREGAVGAIMPSYNEIDGVPSSANRALMDGILRREWGFQGPVVSDYFGIEQLVERHLVAGSLAEAAALALAAGVDQELPDGQAYLTLVEGVRARRIDERAIDLAAGRVLRLKVLAGLFEAPYADADEAERASNTPDARALALEAARRSLVLLKNDAATLPLDRSRIRTLAVVGPNAADLHLGTYSGDPGRGVSVLQGLRDKAGGVRIVYAEGARITEEPASEDRDAVVPGDPVKNRRRIAEAVAVARAADAIVVVVGTNESTSREAWADRHLGDAASVELSDDQSSLIEALAATGRPVVVVVMNGRPLALTRDVTRVPAILEVWYPGQEGGTAVAEAIFGDVNPGGKLPVSLPRSTGQLPVHYNRKPTSFRDYLFEPRAPLFPFGHGLSYTTFRLDELTLADTEIRPDGRTMAHVRVTNTGPRTGDEVVQLYVRDLVASVTRPVKALAGFARVSLQAGESRVVSLCIGPEALSLVGIDLRRRVEPGEFEILVGTSAQTSLAAKLRVRP